MPKPASTTPDSRLIQRMREGVKARRNRLTPPLSSNHHAADPLKTPATSATVITIVLLALVGAPAALSSSTLADFTIADKTMFDLYDYATSNVLLPVGGFFLSVFVGWVWGFDQVKRALSNSGALRNERIIQAFFGTVKFVTPVLVLLVLLDGLNVI